MQECHTAQDFVRLYWALLLGNVLEWYEFSLYGFLTHELKNNFFKGCPWITWFVFAVPFIARPVGGLVLGWIGDTFGRRTAVLSSVWGMLFATTCQSLIPVQTSFSVVILVVLRSAQGIFTGGEYGCVITYMVEVAPSRRLSTCMSLIPVTCGVGFLAALGIIALVRLLAKDEGMMKWAWRIPFILALIPGSLAIWGRRTLRESDKFTEEQQCGSKSPNRKDAQKGDFCQYWHAVVIGALVVALPCAHNIMGAAWMTNYLKEHGLGAQGAETVILCFLVCKMVGSLLGGWLGDTVGIGVMVYVGSFSVAAVGLPVFAAVRMYSTNLQFLILTWGVGWGLFDGVVGANVCFFVAELFPTRVRNRGAALSFNLGVCFLASFSPMAADASLKLLPLGPGILLSIEGVLAAVVFSWGWRLQQRGILQLAHVRPQPYYFNRELTPTDFDINESLKSGKSGDIELVVQDNLNTVAQ